MFAIVTMHRFVLVQFLVHVCPTASYKLPAMSNHSEMELHADGFELLQIDVRSLMGEGFLLGIPASNTGKDLQSMIALQILQKPGCHISLQHESKKLSLRTSLKEQGFHGEVTLCYQGSSKKTAMARDKLLKFVAPSNPHFKSLQLKRVERTHLT